MLAPWTWRNYQLSRQFLPTSTHGGIQLWYGTLADRPLHREPRAQSAQRICHLAVRLHQPDARADRIRRVDELRSRSAPQSVNLVYRLDQGTFQSIALAAGADGHYTGAIPAVEQGDARLLLHRCGLAAGSRRCAPSRHAGRRRRRSAGVLRQRSSHRGSGRGRGVAGYFRRRARRAPSRVAGADRRCRQTGSRPRRRRGRNGLARVADPDASRHGPRRAAGRPAARDRRARAIVRRSDLPTIPKWPCRGSGSSS